MKKMLSLLLATVLVVGLAATAIAAPGSTEATLELTAGQLEIIDPPPGTGDPDLPGVEGGGKDMNFGKREVSPTAQTYFAIKTGVTGADQDLPANYQPVGLAISDARGTTDAKWYTKVSISDFKDDAPTPANSLLGFELTLNLVAGSVVGTGNPATQLPVSVASVKLVAGAAAIPIFEANATNGSPGKWGGNWQPELLVKAATATAFNHTATVLWSVAATP